jgi:hypothetical protein
MYACVRETGRIFRGVVLVRGSATDFSRPTPTAIRELALGDSP